MALVQAVVALELLAFALVPPDDTSPSGLDAVLAAALAVSAVLTSALSRRVGLWWGHVSLGLTVAAVLLGSALRATPQGQAALGVNLVMIGVVVAYVLSRRVLVRYLVVMVGGYLLAVLVVSDPHQDPLYAAIVAVTTVATSLTVSSLVGRLQKAALQDPLTGSLNRRGLALQAPIVRSVAERTGNGTCVVIADLDDFKAYNDRFGHLVGDRALTTIARALQCGMRPQDMLARFGGEEFIVLAVDAGIDVALAIAEQLRADIAALPPTLLGNHERGLTLSLGVASRVPVDAERLEDLLHEADAALYRAKQDGRNCVRAGRSHARGADLPDA